MAEDIKSESAPPPDNSKEFNFRAMERKNKDLESRLEQSDKMLRGMQEEIQRLKPQAASAPQDPFAYYGVERGGLIESEKLIDVMQKERARLEKQIEEKAEKIASSALEKREASRFSERLHERYRDYDEVMTESNYEMLTEQDPEFVESLPEIKDEFKRRELAYKKISKLKAAQKKEPTAQEIADKNVDAAYHYTGGQRGAMTQDINWKSFNSSPEAKSKAYAALKAAQRRGF